MRHASLEKRIRDLGGREQNQNQLENRRITKRALGLRVII